MCLGPSTGAHRPVGALGPFFANPHSEAGAGFEVCVLIFKKYKVKKVTD